MIEHIVDYLESPAGSELSHAIIGLLIALAAYLTHLAHQRAKSADEKISKHVEQHHERP